MSAELVTMGSQAMQAANPGRQIVLAYLNQYKASTLRTMLKYLGIIVDMHQPRQRASRKKATPEELRASVLNFDWTRLDVHFVNATNRKAKDRKYSGATRGLLLSVCRGIAEQLWIAKLITRDDYAQIAKVGSKDKERGKRVEKRSKTIADGDMLKMQAACLNGAGKPKLGLRNYALLSLLLGTGGRSAEVVNLRLDQVDFATRSIVLWGKGDDERRVYVVDGTLEALQRWLDVYTPVDGVLFPAFAPNADEPAQDRAHVPMSYQALYDMVRSVALAAGVPVPSPHSFRHTFAAKTYEASEDIFATQMQMGHKDEKTTRGYIGEITADNAKKRAAKAWKLPSPALPE